MEDCHPTADCEKGNLEIARAGSIRRHIYIHMRARDANAGDACGRIDECDSNVSLFPSGASRGFSEPKRAGTCPGIWDTCRSLLKIDSSLCAAQCISYVHFSARKNPCDATPQTAAEGCRFSIRIFRKDQFRMLCVCVCVCVCVHGSQQC